jgi:simple sugar transport system permease protein
MRNLLSTLFIILLSFVILAILVLFLSKSPVNTLYWFFLGPLQNTYALGNMINSAVPLVFGGLGVAIAMQAGILNLGGEGQIYGGATVTLALALALQNLGLSGALIALLGGCLFSGLIAGASGFFKYRWDTNELISTFLLSQALVLITDYCVTGPLLDPNTNLQSTRSIPDSFRLPGILPPSSLSASLFIAVALVIIAHFFLYHSVVGYEIRMTGLNRNFARYGGISLLKTTVLPLFLSGCLYGLGGGLAIYGSYYSVVKDFSSGMGWASVAVALIAMSKPLMVLPAALFFAWISAGARAAMQFSDVSSELASIVQALVFLLVTSAVLRKLFRGKSSTGRFLEGDRS